MNITAEQNYKIRPSIRERIPETIATAYRAAGLTPPNQGAELLTRLAAEATAETLALELASESVEVTDADAWTEGALARIQRAQAADLLRSAVNRHRHHAMNEKGGILVRQSATDLAKPFASTAKKLTKAAAELPGGDHPLDLEAVVATDTTKARREAGEALTLLGELGSVFGTLRAADLMVRFRDVLYVVDVPAVPMANINRLTRETLNPDPIRDQIRALADDVDRHGVDRALIGVARGEYGGAIAFSLPASVTDLRDRLERGRIAVSALAVDTQPRPQTARKSMVFPT